MSTYLGLDTATLGRVVSCAYVTSTNGIATITLAAAPGYRHHAVGVYWSYSGTPGAGAGISSSGAEGDELDMDITQGGPGPMITPPLVSGRGSALAVSLAAGGVGIVGKLTVFYLTLPG